MSKKNKVAQAAASTAAKPAETAKAENTAKVTTEKDNKSNVTTDKTASTQTKTEKKQDSKAKVDKQSTQKETVQPKPKKDKTPVVIAEEVDETKTLGNKIGVPISSTSMEAIKRSSTDAKAQLVTYGYNRFINNEKFKEECPEAWKNTAQVCDVVWLLAMVDIRNEVAALKAGGQVVAKIPEDQLMPLNEVAEMLGITLAAPKALIGPNGEKQLAIDFNSPETHIPEALNEGAKPIGTVKDPELDYDKVGSDHTLICEALDYMLHVDRNLVISLVKTIEWYQGLCMHNATSADEKIEIDNKPVNEWIEEIFGLVPPTGLLKGLGRSVYLYTKKEGSPISAHCLLRGQLPNWSDDDIARVLKVLIQENFRYSLEDKVDANGNVIQTAKPSPTEDKAIQSVIGNLGVQYVDQLMNDLSLSVPENATDEQLTEIDDKRKAARKIISLVRANIYPGKIQPNTEQLRFAVGKIINTYRQPMDKLPEFEGDYPKLVGEYPAPAPAEDKKESVEKKS